MGCMASSTNYTLPWRPRCTTAKSRTFPPRALPCLVPDARPVRRALTVTTYGRRLLTTQRPTASPCTSPSRTAPPGSRSTPHGPELLCRRPLRVCSDARNSAPRAPPMAALDQDAARRDANAPAADSTPLAQVTREFEQLVRSFEKGLLLSLEATGTAALDPVRRDDIRREACRLAISDLSHRYTRRHIRRSLDAAESEGQRVEEQLHSLTLTGTADDADDDLGSMHNGYFRLYSTELFDLLRQPTDLRFGSLRFHKHHASPHSDDAAPHDAPSPGLHVELALNNSFFVADSIETLPYHTFRLPTTPSLQNRGILSRKAEGGGTFPAFDSWLLFTFLGNGCIKLEVPIEMCADIYGDRLRGRENEEVLFWGFFVVDDD
jgi:hypothetical protein